MQNIAFTLAKTKDDSMKLEKLAHEIWNEYFPPLIGQAQVDYMLEKFASLDAIQQQQKEGCHYYFINCDQEVCGYLAYRCMDDVLFLSKLYVHQEYRGGGYGKKAMNFLMNQANQKACQTIKLTVFKGNVSSISVYEKMGFQKVEDIVMDIGGGFVMDDYVMEKTVRFPFCS